MTCIDPSTAMIDPEQLARHLRHNRGVKIAIHGTVIPPGWTPHPTTARKVGSEASTRLYAKAIRAWRNAVHVSTTWTGRQLPDTDPLYVIG